MPSYTYLCIECDHTSYKSSSYSERPINIECEECGGRAEYTIDTPMVLRASYHDGKRRFTDLKEAAKLHREAAVSKPETAKAIKQEIRRMGVKIEQ